MIDCTVNIDRVLSSIEGGAALPGLTFGAAKDQVISAVERRHHALVLTGLSEAA